MQNMYAYILVMAVNPNIRLNSDFSVVHCYDAITLQGASCTSNSMKQRLKSFDIIQSFLTAII